MRTLTIFLILGLLAAPQELYARDWGGASSRDASGYLIGVGDLLLIEVYDEEDLTKEIRVLTDETISLPLIGTIRAGGLTVSQLESRITKLYGAKYLVNPQVTVIVKEFSNVYVFGEVMEPGNFPIYGRMTVFEAITLAGGFTELANHSKVKVIRRNRRGEQVFNIDLERVTKHGDTSEDIELEANDRVIVSRSFF